MMSLPLDGVFQTPRDITGRPCAVNHQPTTPNARAMPKSYPMNPVGTATQGRTAREGSSNPEITPDSSDIVAPSPTSSSSSRGPKSRVKFVLPRPQGSFPPPSSAPPRRPRPFKYNEAFDYSYFTRVCGLEGTTEEPPATTHVPYLRSPATARSRESALPERRSQATAPSIRCARPLTRADVEYLRSFFGGQHSERR